MKDLKNIFKILDGLLMAFLDSLWSKPISSANDAGITLPEIFI